MPQAVAPLRATVQAMSATDDLSGARAFVAVADRLHVGRAAEALGVSRQTVTARLALYERHAGATLVDRSHRRLVTLTAAGETVLPMARNLLDAASSHDRALRSVAAGDVGVVRFRVVGERTPLVDHLVAVLEDVHAGWRVDVQDAPSREISSGFAYGRLDCAITRRRPLDPHDSNFDRRPRKVEGMHGVRIGDWATGRYASWRSGWRGPHAEAFAGTTRAMAVALRRADALRRREQHRHTSDRAVVDLLRDIERRRASAAAAVQLRPGATASRPGR
jgi:DNA-binding transcriptional LysR family regulator